MDLFASIVLDPYITDNKIIANVPYIPFSTGRVRFYDYTTEKFKHTLTQERYKKTSHKKSALPNKVYSSTYRMIKIICIRSNVLRSLADTGVSMRAYCQVLISSSVHVMPYSVISSLTTCVIPMY